MFGPDPLRFSRHEAEQARRPALTGPDDIIQTGYVIALVLALVLTTRTVPRRAASRVVNPIISAAFSAIMMVGALVFEPISVGVIEASTARRPSIPRTRSFASTTAELVNHHAREGRGEDLLELLNGSFAIASRLPDRAVLNDSAFLSFGLSATTAGTRSRQ
jgi:hypothetical protein